MTDRVVAILSWAVLGALVALVVAAVATQRRGSLDDLTGEEIRARVDRVVGR